MNGGEAQRNRLLEASMADAQAWGAAGAELAFNAMMLALVERHQAIHNATLARFAKGDAK